MAEDILSAAQKQEIREHLATLDVPVRTPADERFFGATVMYLLGATFANMHGNVHGVPWHPDTKRMTLVSVLAHQHALEHAQGGYLVFLPEQQVLVMTVVEHFREKLPGVANAAHLAQLVRAVGVLRERPLGF